VSRPDDVNFILSRLVLVYIMPFIHSSFSQGYIMPRFVCDEAEKLIFGTAFPISSTVASKLRKGSVYNHLLQVIGFYLPATSVQLDFQ